VYDAYLYLTVFRSPDNFSGPKEKSQIEIFMISVRPLSSFVYNGYLCAAKKLYFSDGEKALVILNYHVLIYWHRGFFKKIVIWDLKLFI